MPAPVLGVDSSQVRGSGLKVRLQMLSALMPAVSSAALFKFKANLNTVLMERVSGQYHRQFERLGQPAIIDVTHLKA